MRARHSRLGPGARLGAWMAASNPSAVVLSGGGDEADIAREGDVGAYGGLRVTWGGLCAFGARGSA